MLAIHQHLRQQIVLLPILFFACSTKLSHRVSTLSYTDGPRLVHDFHIAYLHVPLHLCNLSRTMDYKTHPDTFQDSLDRSDKLLQALDEPTETPNPQLEDGNLVISQSNLCAPQSTRYWVASFSLRLVRASHPAASPTATRGFCSDTKMILSLAFGSSRDRSLDIHVPFGMVDVPPSDSRAYFPRHHICQLVAIGRPR